LRTNDPQDRGRQCGPQGADRRRYRIPVSQEMGAWVVRFTLTVAVVGEQRGHGFGVTATTVYRPA